MKSLIAIAIALCACGKPAAIGNGTSSAAAAGCVEVRPKIEQLYRAEAEAKEPKRVAEAVVDNTAMVMNDCARAPATIAACIARVTTVAELEQGCLVPLDDEGTDGEELRR